MPHVATTTAVSQVLAALRLAAAGRCYCTGCDRELHDGHPVTVYASQPAEADRWGVPRVYCMDCGRDEIRTPTLGTTEVLATAWLGVASLAACQVHRLCLTCPEVVAYSPPEEGTRP